MEKKNTGLIIIIVVLALIVGLLGGYLIIDKLIDNNVDVNEQTGNNNDKNEEPTEKDYDLKEAEKIMSNYLIKGFYGNYYIAELDDYSKINLAISKTSISNYSCDQVYGQASYDESSSAYFVTEYENRQYYCTKKNNSWSNSSQFYKYDDVLATKKSLFGSESTLSKNMIGYNPLYHYNEKFDVLVSLYGAFGGIDGPIPTVKLNLNYAKIVGDVLKIGITKIENYTTEDYIKEETREYIFKQEESHWYLTEIKKVNAA